MLPKKIVQPQSKDYSKDYQYADVLYPKEIINIHNYVLGREHLRVPFKYSGDPDQEIDRRISAWTKARISNRDQYIRDVGAAARSRNCGELLFRRINLEAVLAPDKGDTVTILRGLHKGDFFKMASNNVRIFKAKYLDGTEEEISVYKTDNLLDDTKEASKEAKARAKDNQSFQLVQIKYDPNCPYQEAHTVVLRPGRVSWEEDIKQEIVDHLTERGFEVLLTPSAANHALEKACRQYDVEQNILGRLAYLAVFKAFLDMTDISKVRLLQLT